ncbi:DUF4240 domain-containing protein [Massilioclostridium coli]|uniref:DUF4240 domain-containing protein n=1 Tax=Massilioclostridium coli TaxID=1870991 RepID=UPI00085C5815|nr:DUF4240 domain-containing protein [Massilioclostridium coli]
MERDIFWKFIDEINATVDSNDEDAVISATKKKLMELPSMRILQWIEIKDTYVKLADRNDLLAACEAVNLSHDQASFRYFCNWLVAQGKEMYFDALHNPDSLVNYSIPEGKAKFQYYGSATSEAFEEKANLEMMGNIHLNPAASPDWSDSNLTEFVPKLNQKYHLIRSLCKKLEEEYDQYQYSWLGMNRNRTQLLEQMEQICSIQIVYDNFMKNNHLYPQEYLEQMLELDHPLQKLSECYLLEKGFDIHPEMERVIGFYQCDKPLKPITILVDPEAISCSTHKEKMEILDQHLDQNMDEMIDTMNRTVIDAVIKDMDILSTMRQLYYSFKQEKELYPPEVLDHISLLRKPLSYIESPIYKMCVTRKNNPSELESILPKLFSDTPGQELDIEAGSIQI